MRIKQTLIGSLVAATAFLSVGAQAKEVVWDAHDVIEVGIGVTPAGAIDDTYVFTLNDPAILFASAVANNLNGTFGISDGIVSLIKEGPGGAPDVLVGTFNFDGTSGDATNSFGQLMAGEYFYRISGTATGSTGGVYSITSEVTAVPEPASSAMVTAAALVIFLLQRRRNRD